MDVRMSFCPHVAHATKYQNIIDLMLLSTQKVTIAINLDEYRYRCIYEMVEKSSRIDRYIWFINYVVQIYEQMLVSRLGQ